MQALFWGIFFSSEHAFSGGHAAEPKSEDTLWYVRHLF
jgi:hypothetical protein